MPVARAVSRTWRADPREERCRSGTMRRARDLLAEPPGQPLDLGRVVADGAHEARELALDLGHVGGDLGHAAREDVEVVVAVELELGEDVGEAAPRLRGAAGGAPAPRPRARRTAWAAR